MYYWPHCKYKSNRQYRIRSQKYDKPNRYETQPTREMVRNPNMPSLFHTVAGFTSEWCISPSSWKGEKLPTWPLILKRPCHLAFWARRFMPHREPCCSDHPGVGLEIFSGIFQYAVNILLGDLGTYWETRTAPGRVVKFFGWIFTNFLNAIDSSWWISRSSGDERLKETPVTLST